MEISTHIVNDVTVVHVSGRLDTQASGPASDEMTRIATKSNKVLVNFKSLEFLSSAGLRILLRTAKQLTSAGGEMRVCNATGTVKEVMEISGCNTLLDLHDSEREALAAF